MTLDEQELAASAFSERVQHIGTGAAIDVGGFTQIQAHPAAVGQNVMRLRLTRSNHFIAHLRRKRNIDQVIAVNVAEFPLADTILCAAEAVRMGCHPRPIQHRLSSSRTFGVSERPPA